MALCWRDDGVTNGAVVVMRADAAEQLTVTVTVALRLVTVGDRPIIDRNVTPITGR